jgi:selenocysteine lyase/cysteine desulfurase
VPTASVSRRRFLASAGAVSAAALAAQTPPFTRPPGTAGDVARDEAFWAQVAAQYQIGTEVTNLEGGFWGMMARPVLAEYLRHTERVNTESSYYARRRYDADLLAVRTRVATELGVKPTEIAFTRGATEALQWLIGGYNTLKPGDAVLYADVDYTAMQDAMKWLADRRGVRVVRIAIPEPATRANVLEAYAAALRANPDIRLMLLTHLNNKTGLIIPTAEIVAAARARGVDTIVDAAHSWGQTDIKLADIGADFAGLNLHKWIGAPIGVGLMYIKEGRLDAIDRMMGDESSRADSILSRVHTGTANFAAYLTVPAALDFHNAVGPAFKAARVRYLRDRWVPEARTIRGVTILTPDEPGMAAAITSFRLHGQTTTEANRKIASDLLARGIFTVQRSGLDRGDCIRVTPALYNSAADVDRFVVALRNLAEQSA